MCLVWERWQGMVSIIDIVVIFIQLIDDDAGQLEIQKKSVRDVAYYD